MTAVLNPVDIENDIRNVSNRIANGVKVCSDRYKAFKKADHALDVAYATAYLEYEGPAHKAKHVAVLATQTERDAVTLRMPRTDSQTGRHPPLRTSCGRCNP